KYKLPLVIHSRDAFEETMEVLISYTDLEIYFHCWGYDEAEIIKIQESFPKLWIGFCGNISYKNAESLRRSLKQLDLKHLVLETDSPYLSPQVVRGERNQPANIRYIYSFVSKELGIAEDELAKRVNKNFLDLYHQNQ
ncbi:MAG: TatD family deoxyribonuclease, partial [bacterium]|nr:TatD family deoxyribonuclease [bacterium]